MAAVVPRIHERCSMLREKTLVYKNEFRDWATQAVDGAEDAKTKHRQFMQEAEGEFPCVYCFYNDNSL